LRPAIHGYAVRMGIGTSLFLIAAGAILRFAVSDVIEGVELATIGLILMIVGVVGLLISFLYTAMWRDRVIERDPYAPR